MDNTAQRPAVAAFEWQTVLLISFSYLAWIALLFSSDFLPAPLWILLSSLNITLFLSITHEVVHGHPTRNERLNSLLVLLPIGWSFAFERFRDTHLQHHDTGELTDPFDDPESWYLARHDWLSRNRITRAILLFNNTLFGRMLIGPAIGLGRFYASELSLIFRNETLRPYLLSVWGKHLVLCIILALIISSAGSAPLWQWLSAIYLGHSLLLIRTFLEHQASADFSERTVIIEQNCPIAFLFLFNNLHFIHHSMPGVPWYHLPRLYRENAEQYHQENNYYVYRSYSEIIRKYFFKAKEPVPHPLMRLDTKADH